MVTTTTLYLPIPRGVASGCFPENIVAVGRAYDTCSDFLVAIETESSGEPFGNGGDSYWVSDVSEARNIKRERGDGGSGEKETLCRQLGVFYG
ncbi:keratin, type II cytoskeletal 2 epidermal [Gossypium australe]|uniref:Keratin, type II cytoskeletal 2 epidermal n=1 Tax=Gossypium australe TaxID=47621 RepID=A0A5B6VYG2_9ROSI|nr:keratin, type II cytoskeletal 2 epidermal [Gossypium australe]